MAQTSTIAILVPGITGTTLLAPVPHTKATTVIWPDAVAAAPGLAAKLLSTPGIYAGQPIRQIGTPNRTVTIYGGLIDYFTGAGFTYVTQTQPLPREAEKVMVGFGYDWRQPNRTTAAALGTLLTSVASTYPGAAVWLIGHSMGGLVSRYLLESGMAKGATWTVQGLITLGTPHLGAPLALSAITGQCDVSDLLDPAIIEKVVDLPAYPSPFELLPPTQRLFVTDAAGRSWSIYDGAVNQLLTNPLPSGFAAPASSFTDARTFFSGLSYVTPPARGVPPYYLVYGSGLDTISAFTYDPAAPALSGQLTQDDPGGNAAGDGIVPASSASFDGSWVTGTPYDAGKVAHGQLPNDAGVQAKIAAWMGMARSPEGEPAGAAERTTV